MIHRLAHRLANVRVIFVALLFCFWMVQAFGWVAMMAYVQFFNPRLGNSVLYVTQISHWALVEGAGTAAIGAWGLLTALRAHKYAKDAANRLEEHLEEG